MSPSSEAATRQLLGYENLRDLVVLAWRCKRNCILLQLKIYTFETGQLDLIELSPVACFMAMKSLLIICQQDSAPAHYRIDEADGTFFITQLKP
jgi:hypothetical protein